jgi:hypothetical protein
MTKWPRLVVVPKEGHETVTREQANEILVRTNSRHLFSNDKVAERAVATVLGHPHRDSRSGPEAGAVMAWIREGEEWAAGLGMLELHYLVNSRILSAWIGGPHGWCDWDGNLGCSTWNIGKWPDAEEVTEDWQKIAAAFPYLDLHAQCITDEGDGQVAAQWRVTGGQAALVEPIERFRVRQLGEADILFRIIGGGEVGVSLERLREAVGQVRGRREPGPE